MLSVFASRPGLPNEYFLCVLAKLLPTVRQKIRNKKIDLIILARYGLFSSWEGRDCTIPGRCSSREIFWFSISAWVSQIPFGPLIGAAVTIIQQALFRAYLLKLLVLKLNPKN